MRRFQIGDYVEICHPMQPAGGKGHIEAPYIAFKDGGNVWDVQIEGEPFTRVCHEAYLKFVVANNQVTIEDI